MSATNRYSVRGDDPWRSRPLALANLAMLLLSVTAARAADPEPVLRLGLDAVAAYADPHQFNSTDNRNLAFHIFEPLVLPDNELGTLPWLASEWHMEGERTWIFTLRPDVHFHDGKVLTPQDVAFTFCRLDSLETNANVALIAGIEQASARDAHTLAVTTHGPMPLLPHTLTLLGIIPAPEDWKGDFRPGGCAGAAAGLAALTAERFEKGQIPGTGPYRLKSFTSGGPAELVRADHYWGPPQRWQRVQLLPLKTGAARAHALLAGKVDIINQVVPETLEFLAGRSDVKIVDSKPLRTLMLSVNVAGALTDARVRRAIAIAIDRNGLGQRTAQGAEPADQIAHAGIMGYDAAASLPFDQAQARQLLTQAGVQGTLHLRLVTVEPFARVAEGVARYLLAIGIRLDIRYISAGEALGTLRQRDYDLFLGSWVPFTGELGYMAWEMLHSAEADLKAGGQNFGGYRNPEIDRLLSETLVEADAHKRATLLQQVSIIASSDAPVIPLLHTTRRWAMRTDLRFEGRVDGNTLATLITAAPQTQ